MKRTPAAQLPRRRFLQVLGGAALVGAGGVALRKAAPDEVIEFRGMAMGSLYSVRLAGLSPLGQAAARNAVADALERVEAAMSAFRPASELSRFNAHAAVTPFALSQPMLEVLGAAEDANGATHGAFDVTVAPAVDAWGFGPGHRTRVVGKAELAAIAPRVGARLLELDRSRGTIAKARSDVRADLSGIAKGYGVDGAAKALDALGVEHYVIEAGGEVRARGHKGFGRPWQIGIEQPDAMPRRPRYVLPLSGGSIATSGDYRIYFERDGRRYPHEIDPVTSRPVQNGLASVSVVTSECMHADALAKLIVLGPDRALEVATARHLAAYLVVREADGRLTDRMTPAFAALGGLRFDPVEAVNTG